MATTVRWIQAEQPLLGSGGLCLPMHYTQVLVFRQTAPKTPRIPFEETEHLIYNRRGWRDPPHTKKERRRPRPMPRPSPLPALYDPTTTLPPLNLRKNMVGWEGPHAAAPTRRYADHPSRTFERSNLQISAASLGTFQRPPHQRCRIPSSGCSFCQSKSRVRVTGTPTISVRATIEATTMAVIKIDSVSLCLTAMPA